MSKIQNKKEPNPVKGSSKLNAFFVRPVPLYVFLLALLIVVISTRFIAKPGNEIRNSSVESGIEDTTEPNSRVIRQNDTSLIRPLLLVENPHVDRFLLPAKEKIDNYIEQKKNEGGLTSASVYLRDFSTTNHIEINPEELYDPASIMKVPLLLIFLQHAQDNEGLLNKKIFYKRPFDNYYSATIKDKTITPGKSYSIQELLYSMIAYSDNEAFWLLAEEIKNDEYATLCSDFEIPIRVDSVARNNKYNFVANVNCVSRFFRVLYNATYLDRKMSRYAMRLLSASTYKDGIAKGIDSDILIAHKFGERQDENGAQLHEFGIVYLPNRPYLIGIMTKGKDIKQLSTVLGDISRIAYDEMRK